MKNISMNFRKSINSKQKRTEWKIKVDLSFDLKSNLEFKQMQPIQRSPLIWRRSLPICGFWETPFESLFQMQNHNMCTRYILYDCINVTFSR